MKPLTTIIVSMYNARKPAIDIVDKILFPGLINNASSDKQLILLDDCSPAERETAELVEKYRQELEKGFGDVKIGRNHENLGFAGSYNKGIRFADGDALVLVNSDIYLTEGSIGSLVSTLSEDDSYGLVGAVSTHEFGFQNTSLGPKLREYSPEELKQIEEFAKWLGKVMQGRRIELPNTRGMGSCFAARRTPETYFDERFEFGFWEDNDLNERMHRAGYKLIVDPSIYVWHKGNASTFQHKLRFYYHLLANGIKFARKWGSPLKHFYEFALGNLQGRLDRLTVSSDIVKQAKEKGLWQEYQEKFGR
jgi:hypothetical protein